MECKDCSKEQFQKCKDIYFTFLEPGPEEREKAVDAMWAECCRVKKELEEAHYTPCENDNDSEIEVYLP